MVHVETAAFNIKDGLDADESSRRNVRLRREYLYRKQLETNDRIVYEKKRKLKQAVGEPTRASR